MGVAKGLLLVCVWVVGLEWFFWFGLKVLFDVGEFWGAGGGDDIGSLFVRGGGAEWLHSI